MAVLWAASDRGRLFLAVPAALVPGRSAVASASIRAFIRRRTCSRQRRTRGRHSDAPIRTNLPQRNSGNLLSPAKQCAARIRKRGVRSPPASATATLVTRADSEFLPLSNAPPQAGPSPADLSQGPGGDAYAPSSPVSLPAVLSCFELHSIVLCTISDWYLPRPQSR